MPTLLAAVSLSRIAVNAKPWRDRSQKNTMKIPASPIPIAR
jgi:hypothetical protein